MNLEALSGVVRKTPHLPFSPSLPISIDSSSVSNSSGNSPVTAHTPPASPSAQAGSEISSARVNITRHHGQHRRQVACANLLHHGKHHALFSMLLSIASHHLPCFCCLRKIGIFRIALGKTSALRPVVRHLWPAGLQTVAVTRPAGFRRHVQSLVFGAQLHASLAAFEGAAVSPLVVVSSDQWNDKPTHPAPSERPPLVKILNPWTYVAIEAFGDSSSAAGCFKGMRSPPLLPLLQDLRALPSAQHVHNPFTAPPRPASGLTIAPLRLPDPPFALHTTPPHPLDFEKRPIYFPIYPLGCCSAPPPIPPTLCRRAINLSKPARGK